MTAREKVFSYICTTLTSYLQASYGPKSECSRNLDEDVDGLQAEQTPRCYIEEGASSLSDDNGYALRDVRFTIYGLVRLGTNNPDAGVVQAQLNELEAVIDDLLFVSTINGVGVAIFPEDGSRVETAAGASEGWISYPLVVRFGRTA